MGINSLAGVVGNREIYQSITSKDRQMAYSDFSTLSKFKKAFNLRIDEESDLFATVEAVWGSVRRRC